MSALVEFAGPGFDRGTIPTRPSEMCSSLVVKALQKGGLLKDLDPALAFPADLTRVFDARL